MDIADIVKYDNYELLIDKIRNKVKYCWNNSINQSDIEEWLKNFKGKVFEIQYEKILALMLLNNFIYLSHEEVLHLCRVLYYEYVHSIAKENKNYDEIVRQTIFCPIGNPSESSSLVLYFYRIANDIIKDQFKNYPELPELTDKNKRVVFIDDISGSGQQASEYLNKLLEQFDVTKKSNVRYMTLIGTKSASKVFDSIGIKYKSACLLDERMKLFSDSSYTKFSKDESKVLKDLVKGYGDEVKWQPLGYRNSELAIGFYYNVPDNCLPIFWRDNQDWKPIFKRFHKNYQPSKEGEVFSDRDRFI